MKIKDRTITQQKVKHFLNKLSKNSDNTATILRLALEVESMQDNVNKFPDHSQIGNAMETKCKQFLDVLRAYGLCYGKIISRRKYLPVTIIGTLPNGKTIAYCCSRDTKWDNVPLYNGNWDKDIKNNRVKIEQNIIDVYGDILYERADSSIG